MHYTYTICSTNVYAVLTALPFKRLKKAPYTEFQNGKKKHITKQ